MKKILSILLVLAVLLSFAACSGKEGTEGITNTEVWVSAVHQEDTTLGEGKKTVNLTVEARDKTVLFTIKTNAKTVGEALKEHNLIQGEESDFGLYIKHVNGIRADYALDGAFWAFCKDGEMLEKGVDQTPIEEGENNYEFVFTLAE